MNVARVLAPAGFELIAFKGIHIATELAALPWQRPISDADAVLMGGPLRRASSALRSLGCSIEESWSSIILTFPTDARVDLHQRFLPPGLGRIRAASVRRRAQPSRALGGALVPDPADAAVLAIANFVKDMLGRSRPHDLARDLAFFRGAGLNARELWQRLGEHRLRVAGLTALASLGSDGLQWLSQAEPTAAERIRAAALRHVFSSSRTTSVDAGLLLTPLSSDSVTDILTGVAVGAARVLRRRARGAGA